MRAVWQGKKDRLILIFSHSFLIIREVLDAHLDVIRVVWWDIIHSLIKKKNVMC